MKRRDYKRITFLILALLMTAFIWGQSLLPADMSSAQSGFITNIVNEVLLRLNIKIAENDLSFYIRKLAHFTEYFFLAMFWFLYFKTFKTTFEVNIETIGYGLIIAISDELIQNSTPGRAMQITDVFIDLSGVIFFLVVAYIITLINLKRIKQKHTKKAS